MILNGYSRDDLCNSARVWMVQISRSLGISQRHQSSNMNLGMTMAGGLLDRRRQVGLNWDTAVNTWVWVLIFNLGNLGGRVNIPINNPN